MTQPPFSGSIEFKLTIRAFDKSVIRRAMVAYTYTPTWPYYHVRSEQNEPTMATSTSICRCWPSLEPTGTRSRLH
jgi:hypothetical protein